MRDLDIRPESLPEDIGAAARALWDRGEHRAALALLYRGLLSRLAHVHRIPIRDSSTEGDCLALAASHLPQRSREYASRLVRVWQRFVYGGQHTEAATVHALCDDFGVARSARRSTRSTLESQAGRRGMTRCENDLAARRRPLVALIAWIASNTYWADTKVPMPPKGEALTNPFYAAQRFAEALGARTAWDRVLVTPPADAVIVLSTWNWNLTTGRREALERWVESGGRLVVDETLVGGETEFERWSGIVRQYRERTDAEESVDAEDGSCRRFQEDQNGTPAGASPETQHWMCGLDSVSSLTSERTPSLGAPRRVRHAGDARRRSAAAASPSSTPTPFRHRSLFDGDHGWLFAAATELRRGDDVHFLSEDEHPSLLALLWRLRRARRGARADARRARAVARRRPVRAARGGAGPGAPLAGRADPRHGAVRPAPRRRELAARGLSCARSTKRRDAGSPATRALSPDERAAALARLTGLDRDALAAALQPTACAAPTSSATRSRCSRRRGAEPSSRTRGSRMEQIETDRHSAGRVLLDDLRAAIGHAMVGQSAVIEQVLIALVASGHVLIEGVPGLGKTLLVRALAQALSLAHARVQFTPDMMPSDITGHAVLDPSTRELRIVRGPVFTHVLLADEINRAPAKTQSALLEVMQEYQVTLEGQTLPLPKPFMVLATQNPVETEGTYPLPEAQLDRFLFKVEIGYPSSAEEVAIVVARDHRPGRRRAAAGGREAVPRPPRASRSCSSLRPGSGSTTR